MLTVTILIPAHNEADTIEDCISACWGQTYPIERVIVVADQCSDRTAAIARTVVNTDVVEVSGGSKARALNAVLPLVRTDLVVGLDGDTVLADDAVEHKVATIQKGYDGTCGAVMPLPSQPRTMTVRARSVEYAVTRRWGRPVQKQLGRLTVLSGATSCYKTGALRSVGGFPEDVPIGEDAELTWRLQAAGYRLGFSPRAVAYTTEPETWKVYVAVNRRWAASSAQIIARRLRDLSHPGRFLIIACRLFDLVGTSIVFWGVVLLGFWRSPAALIGVSVVTLLTLSASGTIAVRELGWREALKSYPCAMLANWVVRWTYVWALFREWVLGKHYVTWTGRHGRAKVITPMSERRKGAFTLLALVQILSLDLYKLVNG